MGLFKKKEQKREEKTVAKGLEDDDRSFLDEPDNEPQQKAEYDKDEETEEESVDEEPDTDKELLRHRAELVRRERHAQPQRKKEYDKEEESEEKEEYKKEEESEDEPDDDEDDDGITSGDFIDLNRLREVQAISEEIEKLTDRRNDLMRQLKINF